MSSNGRLTRTLLITILAGVLVAGCGREETPQSAPGSERPARETAAAPPVQKRLKRLAEQEVDPAATEQASLSTPDGRLDVVVPPGGFAEAEKLVISSVEGAVEGLSECFDTLGVFDISAGKQQSFEKPLEITFSLQDIGRELEDPGALHVAWWHEDSARWISMPSSVDAEAETVTVEMPHLTVLGWFMSKAGYERRQLGKFEVLWDKEVLTPPKDKTNPKAWAGKIMYSSANDAAQYVKAKDAPYLKDTALPPLVRDVGAYLNYALKQYEDAEWKIPDTPITVVIETSLTSENARDKALGIIHIGEYNTGSAQLKTAAAHELLHAVQNEYLWSFGGMTFLGWFCESTAEYAGSIVWGETEPSRRVPPKYFSERLDAEKHEHEYHSAHFIDHIVGSRSTQERLEKLRALWTGTLKNHGITDANDILFPLHQYLMANGGGLSNTFRNHVYEVCLAPGSPMVSGKSGSTNKPPAAMLESKSVLEADQDTAPALSMMLKGGHRAKVWAVRAEMKGKKKSRSVKLNLGGDVSGRIQASAHVLPGGLRSRDGVVPSALFLGSKRETQVTLSEDDVAYVIVSNHGSKAANLTLEIEEGEESLLDALHMTNRVLAALKVTHPNGYTEKIVHRAEDLKWSGTSFVGSLSVAGKKSYGRTTDRDVRINGKVSADCSRLLQLTVKETEVRVSDTPTGPFKRTLETDMGLSDVPVHSHSTGDQPRFSYSLDAPIDKRHISYKLRNTDKDGTLESGLNDIFLEKGSLDVYFSTR